MNKHLNKYFQRDKEVNRLQIALDKNYHAQKNLGKYELPEPIPHGFIASYKLRSDIALRGDAWVFNTILYLCGVEAWRRKNNFHVKKLEGTMPYPHFCAIDEGVYAGLDPQLKKWFQYEIDKYGRVNYYHTVPYFFFELGDVRQDYITHVNIIDEILLQEEVEIEKRIDRLLNRRSRYWHRGAPKSYVKFYNASHRAKEKMAVKKIIDKGIENAEFPGRHRHSAEWDCS